MKKVQLISRFILAYIIMVVCITASLCIVAKAESAYLSVSTGDVAAVQGICTDANAACGKTIMSCTTGGALSFDVSLYNTMTSDEKEKFMETALQDIKNSGFTTSSKNRIYNFVAGQDSGTSAAIKYLADDTRADIVKARKWLSPFSNGVSTVIGIGCLLIFMFIGLGTVFDIAYLSLPFFQLFIEKGDEHKKPFGISYAAWQVHKIAEEGTNRHEGILSTYFKKRIPEIIIIAICVGYLVSGKVYEILSYFADAFQFL